MTRVGTLAVVLALVVAGCLGGSGATNVADELDAPGTATMDTPGPTATPATATATTSTGTTDSRSVPIRSYDDRESLVEAAPFAVPDPDVPARFTFDSGIVSTAGNTTRVSLAYHHVVGEGQDAELRNVLSVGTFASEALDLDRGEAVTVDGHEMRYVADGDRRKLLWRCSGYTYRVSVQGFDDSFGNAELSAVAASVECSEGTTGEEPRASTTATRTIRTAGGS